MMMRPTVRDVAASVLFLAVGIPYVGFLVRGEMPFVQDERGMSAVGLVLGTAALLVLRRGDPLRRIGTAGTALLGVTMAVGLVSLAFAETASAPWLLAGFMGILLIAWAVELADHVVWVHRHGGTTSPGS